MGTQAALGFPAWYEHADAIGRNGAHFFCVQFDPAPLIEAYGSAKVDHAAQLIENSVAMNALTRTFTAFVAGQEGVAIESYLWEFLSTRFEPGLKPAAPETINSICEWLHASPHAPPSLAQLAAEFGMHRATIARQFRMATGSSIGEYHRMARRQEALNLLLAGKLSLCGIAQAAGYSDQSHMTRDFAANHGVPPQRLRKLTSVHFTGKQKRAARKDRPSDKPMAKA